MERLTPKKAIGYSIILVLIPLFIAGGAFLLENRQYVWISLCIAVLACVPFFAVFEKKTADVRRMVVLAVLVALSVLGRFAFSFVPHFKPVTAIVILAGLYLGAESGFLCGALSAFLSNFFFGQGPWTPFQMLGWGIIGFFAGLFSKPLRKHLSLLLLYGGFAGAIFSLLMDVWTVLWLDGSFLFARYAALVAAALPVTAIYAASNLIFLLLLARPLGKKLDRIERKYGL
jgi:uncharacterized membrane protein